MSTLSTFSGKERQYHQYQARQEYLREQRTIQLELEQAGCALIQAKQREEKALQEKEIALQRETAAQQRETAALQEKEAALAKIERLKALLVR